MHSQKCFALRAMKNMTTVGVSSPSYLLVERERDKTADFCAVFGGISIFVQKLKTQVILQSPACVEFLTCTEKAVPSPIEGNLMASKVKIMTTKTEVLNFMAKQSGICDISFFFVWT